MKWVKTDEEIETMKKSGHICATALKEVLKSVKVFARGSSPNAAYPFVQLKAGDVFVCP